MNLLLKLFFTLSLPILVTHTSSIPLQASYIDPKGSWHGSDVQCFHIFDPSLAQGLVDFFKQENANSVVDFGCGMGDYQLKLLQNGINTEAYDGNPDTPLLTQGRAGVQDLSIHFDLNKRYDWVMSLEVGEHIPKEYERIFIENLIRHATNGIVLSWAIPNQGGHGHFNEQSNQYIKDILASYGWYNDENSENVLRKTSQLHWFKNTIMVFRKL